MQYTNKKYILLSTILFTVLLAWCTFRPNSSSTQVGTWNSIDTGNNKVFITSWTASSKYLSWYTWESVVITPDNSGAIVIQPWDELLYRNEAYWFQVLLGKEWKGGKICTTEIPMQKYAMKSLMFSLSGSESQTNATWENRNPDKSSCSGVWYTRILELDIYDYSWHNIMINTPWMDGTTWELVKGTYGVNNKYYLVSGRYWADDYMHKLIPSLTCHTSKPWENTEILTCPEWKNKIFLNKFTTFNIQ